MVSPATTRSCIRPWKRMRGSLPPEPVLPYGVIELLRVRSNIPKTRPRPRSPVGTRATTGSASTSRSSASMLEDPLPARFDRARRSEPRRSRRPHSWLRQLGAVATGDRRRAVHRPRLSTTTISSTTPDSEPRQPSRTASSSRTMSTAENEHGHPTTGSGLRRQGLDPRLVQPVTSRGTVSAAQCDRIGWPRNPRC